MFEKIGEKISNISGAQALTLSMASLELSGSSAMGVYAKKLIENPNMDSELNIAISIGGSAVLGAAGLTNWMIYRSGASEGGQ